MTPFLHRIWAGYETAMVRAGRDRARRHLLRMSDRSLADAGFSRDLLECGIGAWPWRPHEDDTTLSTAIRAASARRSIERRAVRELHGCSDAELADLGIARTDIERAVCEGRVGIEVTSSDKRESGGERWAA